MPAHGPCGQALRTLPITSIATRISARLFKFQTADRFPKLVSGCIHSVVKRKAYLNLRRSLPPGRPFSETVLSGDLQYVLVLDRYQNWIDTLVWQRADEGYWHYFEFDLRPYAGSQIYLQFGTYNDGGYGVTSMYVDDVSQYDCAFHSHPGTQPHPYAHSNRFTHPNRLHAHARSMPGIDRQ